MPTADDLIGAYVKIRDQKKELTDMQKDQVRPFNDKLEKLEAGLANFLHNSGSESIKSKSGTAFFKTRTSVRIEDWESFLDFVKDNELWHMLIQGAAKQAVEDFIEAQKEAPPGVAISSEVTVNVRRGK